MSNTIKRLVGVILCPSSLTEVIKMDLNGCCALSGCMAHLGNTGLGESTAFIVVSEPEELVEDLTLSLKVIHCKHIPDKWPVKNSLGLAFLAYSARMCGDIQGPCTVTPPNNLPLSAADQSFDNSLDFGPLIAVTTIASAEFKRAGALSAPSVFSLAEPKVIQAHAYGRMSVDPRALLSQ